MSASDGVEASARFRLEEHDEGQAFVVRASILRSLGQQTLSLRAAVFTVTRTGPTAFAVQVNYQTADGTALTTTGDYTAQSGTVEIPPGGHEATQTVSVPVTNDAWAEPPETFTLTLSAPVHATLGTAVGTATIVDDDGPYVALNLGLSGVYLADVPSGPGAEGYVLLGNPQGAAVTARLTFVPETGGARVRDVGLGPWARATVHVGSAPGIAGRGLVSVAVQSATPGAVVDAEHATYWSDGWAIGRSTEGVAPASTCIWRKGRWAASRNTWRCSTWSRCRCGWR